MATPTERLVTLDDVAERLFLMEEELEQLRKYCDATSELLVRVGQPL